MTSPYLCPNCKTNRTRFNLIEQLSEPVKLDPATGAVVERYEGEQLSPFHVSYQGPQIKVQCGVCGLIEDEKTFIKLAEYHQYSSPS
ncbi:MULTISPECIES: hypothetical protein [Bacillus]|jgi:rubredoxin|uniref:DNA alkylation repair protein n=1 Tax=Bacillus pumilus TaxID=1408 RepID=A0AAE4B7W0_BACPU|nr:MULTISPECIES: hypothetical protein [Bacillus]AOC56440.1 DNA alkylation repair protein [Bacillus pumilus]AZV52670.1 DNA alkylation repair protein [Bacillus pumilus]MBR0585812.1 DNA alkylation repair protein [Bacillus pumilus DW2J2]MBR0617736.1 DNA alkylation repair protein [Bacillus pumilus]MBR0619406.1 DNA alkylation repair protein [Bacillus pumilus]